MDESSRRPGELSHRLNCADKAGPTENNDRFKESSTPRSEQKLSKLHSRIIERLRTHPEGVTLNALQVELGIAPGKQIHFNRRFRDLYPRYEIEKRRVGPETLYTLKGEKAIKTDSMPINKTLRAAVLHASGGRCGMCGRSIAEHGVVLVIDHKTPRAWGGRTEFDNLWGLCSECNEGKRDFFTSIESPEAKHALSHRSVHVRIGELLKAYSPGAVPSSMLALIAGQSDWMKRLRELRYLGWKIKSSKRKLPSGRVESFYAVEIHRLWPADPTAEIREFERNRAQKNRR